jgi:muconolactone delta-isomerase
MSTTANPVSLPVFMVVATVRDDTNFAELAALRADEHNQLKMLQSEGRVGAHHLALARRTAFLEVMAADERHAEETVATLPFSKFFDIDIYPIAPPDSANPAPRVQL